MSSSKLGWLVAGLAGAAAVWSYLPAEPPPPPPAPVVAPQPEQPQPAVFRPKKKSQRVVARSAAAVVEEAPKPLPVPAPDVSACGGRALVSTEVIAHVHVRDSGRLARVSVSATPHAPDLVECVRSAVANAKVDDTQPLQTFRYAFKPQ